MFALHRDSGPKMQEIYKTPSNFYAPSGMRELPARTVGEPFAPNVWETLSRKQSHEKRVVLINAPKLHFRNKGLYQKHILIFV